jgi:hypothetical protein
VNGSNAASSAKRPSEADLPRLHCKTRRVKECGPPEIQMLAARLSGRRSRSRAPGRSTARGRTPSRGAPSGGMLGAALLSVGARDQDGVHDALHAVAALRVGSFPQVALLVLELVPAGRADEMPHGALEQENEI